MGVQRSGPSLVLRSFQQNIDNRAEGRKDWSRPCPEWGLSLTPGLAVLSGMWEGQVASCERPWAAVHLGTVAYSGSKRRRVCCPCLVPRRHCPCLPITHLCSRAQFLLTFFSLLTRTRSPQARAAGPAHYFTPGHYLV